MSAKNQMLTLYHALSHHKAKLIENLRKYIIYRRILDTHEWNYPQIIITATTLKRRQRKADIALAAAEKTLGDKTDAECEAQWTRFKSQLLGKADPLSDRQKAEQAYVQHLMVYYPLQ